MIKDYHCGKLNVTRFCKINNTFLTSFSRYYLLERVNILTSFKRRFDFFIFLFIFFFIFFFIFLFSNFFYFLLKMLKAETCY